MSRLKYNISSLLAVGVLLLMSSCQCTPTQVQSSEDSVADIVESGALKISEPQAEVEDNHPDIDTGERVMGGVVASRSVAQAPVEVAEAEESDTLAYEEPIELAPEQSEEQPEELSEAEIKEEPIAEPQVSELQAEPVKSYTPLSERPVVDRAINQNPFIYKGEFVVGVWATHGSMDSSNAQTLLLLNNISASGNYTSVEPYLGYTYHDNRVVGVRFGYTNIALKLDSATIDLGEANDLTFDIPYINYSQRNFNYGIFHRSYAGLDSKGHFALFADLDLSYSRSNSTFDIESGGELSRVRGESWGVDLNFNPGVAVYIMPNVSGTLSFGLGGINYSSVQQYDLDGEKIGESSDSKLSFKFNILAINIGLNIHLWSYE